MEVTTSSALLLPFTASSVGVARRRLIGDLAEAGVYEATACDAGLVISELISNALRHASPLQGCVVKVSWELHADSVEVAVSDGGGPTAPAVNEPTNWSIGGRGLGNCLITGCVSTSRSGDNCLRGMLALEVTVVTKRGDRA
jgi:anti-sigma regulatory factor (Ser/Thr protein kinase)